jgi:hypothetical protein
MNRKAITSIILAILATLLLCALANIIMSTWGWRGIVTNEMPDEDHRCSFDVRGVCDHFARFGEPGTVRRKA